MEFVTNDLPENIDQQEEERLKKIEEQLEANKRYYEEKRRALKAAQKKYGVIHENSGAISLMLGLDEYYDKTKKFEP